MLAIVIVIIVVLLVVLTAAVGFNALVRQRNRTREAWSQIDVELKRRHDLIPNLVHTVKGYAAHESGTFQAVTAARAAAITAGAAADPAAVAGAEHTLTRTVHSLLAVAENYPALRAQEGFLDLQEQLTATEDNSSTPAGTTTRASATTTPPSSRSPPVSPPALSASSPGCSSRATRANETLPSSTSPHPLVRPPAEGARHVRADHPQQATHCALHRAVRAAVARRRRGRR